MTDKQTIHIPSSLFPFMLNDLDDYEYGNYRLLNVFDKITPDQRKQCVKLWLRNGVLPSRQAALERSDQVCYFITQIDTGELIAVNTLYDDLMPGTQLPVFMNRMFIDPAHRHSRLMIIGTGMMLIFAKTKLENSKQLGVANINENVKLSRRGANRIFRRFGYRQLGYVAGQELLFFEFSRILIEESPAKKFEPHV